MLLLLLLLFFSSLCSSWLFCLQVQINYTLGCPCISLFTPLYLHNTVQVFSQCKTIQSTAKATGIVWLTQGCILQVQQSVYLPGEPSWLGTDMKVGLGKSNSQWCTFTYLYFKLFCSFTYFNIKIFVCVD